MIPGPTFIYQLEVAVRSQPVLICPAIRPSDGNLSRFTECSTQSRPRIYCDIVWPRWWRSKRPSALGLYVDRSLVPGRCSAVRTYRFILTVHFGQYTGVLNRIDAGRCHQHKRSKREYIHSLHRYCSSRAWLDTALGCARHDFALPIVLYPICSW